MHRSRRLLTALALGFVLALVSQAAVYAQTGTTAPPSQDTANQGRSGGQITAISGNVITVTRRNGASATIVVKDTTSFTRNGQSATLADFHTGDFVRAHGSVGGDGQFVADRIVGSDKAPKGRAGKSAPPQ